MSRKEKILPAGISGMLLQKKQRGRSRSIFLIRAVKEEPEAAALLTGFISFE
jgi:hypothetical protein